MDIKPFAALTIASIDFLIAAVFYLQARRDPARTAYAVFALAVAFWGWGVGFFLWVSDPTFLNFLARALYFAGGFIPPTFYYFTIVFAAYEVPKFQRRALIFLPSLILFFLYFFSDLIISGFLLEGGVKGFHYGPLRWLFDINLWFVFILALRELFKKYKTLKDQTQKSQIIFITLGTYLVLAVAGVTNVFDPFFYNFRYIWIGPTATIIWVALVAYALLKHQLLNAKVIATEFFVSLIWLASVVETVLSQSTNELLRKFFMLVLGVGLFGYFLIKSVYREVRQREEIERLAGDLAKANEELKKLDAAKSEFISLAGHQLRAPLTAIKGYVSMILEGSYGKIEASASEALRRVFVSADQLVKLASELLDLSRIEAGRFKYVFARLDFADIIKKALAELDEVSKERGIAMEFIDENKENFKIMADADKMHELVINLADNALKYSKEGPIIIKLEAIYSQYARHLRLSVQDKGIGIPKEELDKLFTKFTRTDVAKKTRPEGMGLGLYFVKKIAESHGGRVWAESEGIGSGSKFVAELPVSMG